MAKKRADENAQTRSGRVRRVLKGMKDAQGMALLPKKKWKPVGAVAGGQLGKLTDKDRRKK